jgi:transposase
VAIETSHGPEVERLLALGVSVFPMNPKAAERYRDRKAPSGVKDDLLDAWSFADALRTDGQAWRPLRPEDEQTQLLRLLCRDEIGLIEQRTALVLQLRAALREYYPAALEAFDEWAKPCAWEFISQFPTPAAVVKAGKRRWQKFLHTHRLYRPELAQKRMEIFARADQFASPCSAVTDAKSLLAVSLARQLRTLESQIAEYRQRIQKLFADHPDSDIFNSLPGAGNKLAPRLLGEMGSNRDVFESAQALQCYAGSAPVTKKSGKSRLVFIRGMCNKVLRATVHLWVDESRKTCAWAQAYYQQKKQQGKSHAQALRCLGQRWLKILWKMWTTHTLYDEALHMLNMTRHGSWVLGQLPPLQT